MEKRRDEGRKEKEEMWVGAEGREGKRGNEFKWELHGRMEADDKNEG